MQRFQTELDQSSQTHSRNNNTLYILYTDYPIKQNVFHAADYYSDAGMDAYCDQYILL